MDRSISQEASTTMASPQLDDYIRQITDTRKKRIKKIERKLSEMLLNKIDVTRKLSLAYIPNQNATVPISLVTPDTFKTYPNMDFDYIEWTQGSQLKDMSELYQLATVVKKLAS